MPALRIALFSRATPAHHPAGGMERHTDQLARGLARRGHAVTVFTTALPPAAAPDAGEPGLEFRYLAGTHPGAYRGGYWRRSRTAFAAEQAAQAFDAILSQSAGAWGALELPAGERPPCLAVLHGSTGGELATAWRSRPLSPRTWVKTALGLHYDALNRRRLPRCAALVAVSAAVAGRLAREYPAQAAALRVIPNGVDTAGWSPADPAASRLVLYAGRVIAEKGIFVLLEAFARIAGAEPHWLLRIVGGGELAALRARVVRLGLGERVEVLGALPHARMGEHYGAAALLALPTLRDEGLPLSVLEAMACGLPVLAVARGGLGEAVRDGEEGVLLDRAEAGALAIALGRLIAAPAERARLGRAARARAEAIFSETAMLAAYGACLAELTGRGESQPLPGSRR